MKHPIYLLIVFLISCGDGVNDLDLNKDPLRGVLAGTEWNYRTGAGQYNPGNFIVQGMLVDFELEDPCSLIATTTNYVEMSVPADLGTFTLSATQNTNVIFHLQNGVRYTVGAGFIQVVRFNGNALIGYLSADLDDENKVQGSFLLAICN